MAGCGQKQPPSPQVWFSGLICFQQRQSGCTIAWIWRPGSCWLRKAIQENEGAGFALWTGSQIDETVACAEPHGCCFDKLQPIQYAFAEMHDGRL